MTYKKGAKAERELAELLWKRGFAVIRSAGSGNSYSPDIVAIKNGRVFAFECKAWKKTQIMINENQMNKMDEWRRRSGADLFIAWKYPYRGWFFIPIHFLQKKNSYYVIDLESASRLSYNLFLW